MFTPTPAQLALLRVVVGDGEDDARTRFERWAGQVDIDTLPLGSHGLLPAAYRVAESAGVEHEWMGRLRGVYRRHWTAGELARAATADAVGALETAGIETVNPADQQLADRLVDPAVFAVGRPRICVRWGQCEEAWAVLSATGWRPDPEPSGPRRLRRRLTWATWSIRRDGSRIDLVSFFNPRLVGHHRDAALWRRVAEASGPSGAVAVEDLFVAALCDQLDVQGALRWVLPADALLAANGDGFDLMPILDMSSARLLLPTIAARLHFLANEVGTPGSAAIAEQVARVARHRGPRSGPMGPVIDLGGRSRRAAARLPGAVREIVGRHGGVGATVAAVRSGRPRRQ